MMGAVTRILAVANNKGGVAKTTTVASLGAAFAEQGLRVLLVDLDPQACLTFSLGVDPDDVVDGVHELLLAHASMAGPVASHDRMGPVVVTVGDGLDLVPATIDLAAAEAELLDADRREWVLSRALADLRVGYDIVIVDCSPSLGLLTVNALTAADEVLVPLQCEMLSHRGVGQLLDAVGDVQRLVNPDLVMRGVLPTMFDARTTHSRAVLADVAQRYGLPVLDPPIPRSVRFAEAPALGRTILETARSSRGAQAYRQVAIRLLQTWGLAPGRRATRR
jgi:chromosome partitioning protein